MAKMAKLRDVEVPQQFLDAVAFEPLAVKDEFSGFGVEHAYLNELHANALREKLMTEAKLEQVKAATELVLRAEAEVTGAKVTEATIKAKVTVSADVIAAVEKHITAEVEERRLRGRLEALASKREGTVSYGAHVRKEMDGDPVVRDYHAAAARAQGKQG